MILQAIAEFIGRLLKQILPELFTEYRKPRRTRYAPHDPKIQEDINRSIDDAIRRKSGGMPDGVEPGRVSETPRRTDADSGNQEELG